MVLTDAKLKRMRAKAQRATEGPWEAAVCGDWMVMAGPLLENRRGLLRGGRGAIAQMDDLDLSKTQQEANARFISSVDPDVVMALVDEILALRAEKRRGTTSAREK